MLSETYKFILGLATILTPIVLAWIAVVQQRSERSAKEVKETLAANTSKQDKQLDVIEKTGEKTHTLVNSNMGVQLRMHADLTQRMAEKTNEPEDIAAALQAKKLWDEHQGKQATVDAGMKTSGMPPLPDTHDFNDNPGQYDKPKRSDT